MIQKNTVKFIIRNCQACQLCYTLAPEHFASDENGYSYIISQPNEETVIGIGCNHIEKVEEK